MNRAPVAEAGGPYAVAEGSAVVLDGTGSSDPDGDTLTYAWDLDNDGQFDDSAEAMPSVLNTPFAWPLKKCVTRCRN